MDVHRVYTWQVSTLTSEFTCLSLSVLDLSMSCYSRDNWTTDARFIIGVIMFGTGFILNIHADTVLLNLRAQRDKEKDRDKSEKAGGYRIPYGGLFELVSCANYSK